MALAATILLSFTVTLMVLQDSREIDSEAPAKKAGMAEERGEPAPSTPPKTRSTPHTDNRRDRGAESLALAEGADASRPGFVPDAPLEARAGRKSDPRAAAQPVPAGPAAPAAAASPRLESALQRADAASGQAGGVAVSEAKDRRPEKWIEDIRRLRVQGKTEEADRDLAKFKKRYPEHRLPDDLR